MTLDDLEDDDFDTLDEVDWLNVDEEFIDDDSLDTISFHDIDCAWWENDDCDARSAATGQPTKSASAELPYNAASVNGRAIEWKGPLWDAIDAMADFRYSPTKPKRQRRPSHVIAVENAVELAMRIAVEEDRVRRLDDINARLGFGFRNRPDSLPAGREVRE